MKNAILFVTMFLLIMPTIGICAPDPTEAELVRKLRPVYDDSNSEVLYKHYVFSIDCFFDSWEGLTIDNLLNIENWKVSERDRLIRIDQIKWTATDSTRVGLYGNFEGLDNLQVSYKNGKKIRVDISTAVGDGTVWGFGEGKALNFDIRRLTDQKAFFAFDYDLAVSVAELNLSSGLKNFWFGSFTLDLISGGTIGSDDEVRNGTESSINLTAIPYYFVSDMIYRAEIYAGLQLETEMDSVSDKLFSLSGKRFEFGLKAEIPLTNKPIYWLHTKTGYVRRAMPLTATVKYMPGASDGAGYAAFPRWQFEAEYELAFSPYLIVQGGIMHSRFSLTEADSAFKKKADYYALAIAQDLDVVGKHIGPLGILFGTKEEMRGKHFMFFRYTEGRKAPNFKDIKEYSLGYSVYF
jgi:hypothetical protein